MSNLSDLDTMILRDTTNPPLTNKGSALTYGEFDGNFVEIYNAIQDIVTGENVEAYDAGATYDAYSTDVYEQYCGYDSRIWKAVWAGSPSSFTGQTPAEGAYWTQVSLAQMIPNIMALAQLAYSTAAGRRACPVYCAELSITTAQVLALNSTPLEIVAAPGAGYAIQVMAASAKITYNSIPYATNISLVLISDTSTNEQAVWTAGFLDSNSTLISPAQLSNIVGDVLKENEGLNVMVATDNPTAGNSGIKVYVKYMIIQL